MLTIPRTKFVAFIEEGIKAGRIDGVAAEKLRKVGRTAKRVGTGSFAVTNMTGKTLCHCPMSAAHLATDDGDPRPRSGLTAKQVSEFANTFDVAVDDYCDANRVETQDAYTGSYFVVAP